VKGSEVMILGKMCVLSLIYSNVSICRFCAVRCVIIICFCMLFSNYSTYVFLIFFVCLFFVFLFYILCILCFCIVLCIVSRFVLSVSYFCISLPTTATGLNPVTINKYRVVSCHVMLFNSY